MSELWMVFLFQSWSQLLLVGQAVAATALLIVAVVYSIRMGSTKAWKDRAEERKETIADRDAEIQSLEKRLAAKEAECEESGRRQREAERRSNEASQYNFELQGKLRLYERKYGPIRPEDSHS